MPSDPAALAEAEWIELQLRNVVLAEPHATVFHLPLLLDYLHAAVQTILRDRYPRWMGSELGAPTAAQASALVQSLTAVLTAGTVRQQADRRPSARSGARDLYYAVSSDVDRALAVAERRQRRGDAEPSARARPFSAAVLSKARGHGRNPPDEPSGPRRRAGSALPLPAPPRSPATPSGDDSEAERAAVARLMQRRAGRPAGSAGPRRTVF
jgi:hypothetical protein